jgi:hypothetical protein
LFDELIPPPTRKFAARLTVTYAGFTGEGELLEELYARGIKQPQVAPNVYAGDGILMAWHHEPVAPWQDARWLNDARRSLRPNQYARMIENRFVAAESTFINSDLWDACTDPRLGHMVADQSLPVWAACDASTKHDSTALACVTWSKEHQHVRLVDHRIFVPSAEQPIDFAADVERTLSDWHKRFNLKVVWFDPFQMAASAQRLQRQGLRLQEYPQSLPNLTAMGENLFALIKGRNLLVYPDEQIRTAVLRAIAVEGGRGWKIDKAKQSHRIDIVVALGMAALAAVRAQSESTFDESWDWVDGVKSSTSLTMSDTDKRAAEGRRNAEWRKTLYMQHLLGGGASLYGFRSFKWS